MKKRFLYFLLSYTISVAVSLIFAVMEVFAFGLIDDKFGPWGTVQLQIIVFAAFNAITFVSVPLTLYFLRKLPSRTQAILLFGAFVGLLNELLLMIGFQYLIEFMYSVAGVITLTAISFSMSLWFFIRRS